jgi:hypothetical protein
MPAKPAILSARDIARLLGHYRKRGAAGTLMKAGRPDAVFERVLSSGSLNAGRVALRFRANAFPPLSAADRRDLSAALAYEGRRWLISKGIRIHGVNARRASPTYITAGPGSDKRAEKVLAAFARARRG